ncbi:MAG: hypothetical protein WCH20_01815 [Nitrospira sp.]
MSLTLDITKQAFLKAMQTGDTLEQTLHIVVVRLLAIALKLRDCGQPQDQSLKWPLPERYHNWPMVESEMETPCRRRQLRFYVSPKAATLSVDEPFPVSTVFVVETSSIEPLDEPLVSRFVMGKYADVTTGERNSVQQGAWASATYGLAGDMLPDAVRITTGKEDA